MAPLELLFELQTERKKGKKIESKEGRRGIVFGARFISWPD